MPVFYITQSLFITKWIFIVPIFFKLPFIKSSLAFGLQLMIILCKVICHEAKKNPEVKLLEGQIRTEEFVVLAVIANHTILIFLGSGAITLNITTLSRMMLFATPTLIIFSIMTLSCIKSHYVECLLSWQLILPSVAAPYLLTFELKVFTVPP
jgi:hypothetical protein